jgi:hypothetical protein
MSDVGDIVVKLIGFLAEKYAAASKYIVAGIFSAALIAGVLVYFFGGSLIEPRIDYYLMTKMNAYFEGDEGSFAAAARNVDPKIKNLAVAQLESIRNSLYEEVDAVYPITYSFTKAEIAKLDPNSPLTFPLYLYADLSKHRVSIFLNRRNNTFSVLMCFNHDQKSCRQRTSNLSNEDITETLRSHPLKPGSGGIESETLTYPPNIQLIEISPQHLNWDEGADASVEGYVMVRRAIQGQPK